MSKPLPMYLRNLVFGVEDGLVSTVGFLAGISAGSLDKSSLILSGLVLILVEAFSMGVGSFLSESSAEDAEKGEKKGYILSMRGGLIMFFSYIFAGLWILLPYIFTQGITGIVTSVLFAFLALSVLGLVSAKITSQRPLKRIIRMIIAGGLAILLGISVGLFLKK
jgi:VIT1/CCC1 family predicted Fe2+/Mn2+ transporter